MFANRPGFQTWAAAAINDPFFLSTDPLPHQSLFTFDFVEDTPSVPEPGSLTLLVAGLCAFVLVRRRGTTS